MQCETLQFIAKTFANDLVTFGRGHKCDLKKLQYSINTMVTQSSSS